MANSNWQKNLLLQKSTQKITYPAKPTSKSADLLEVAEEDSVAEAEDTAEIDAAVAAATEAEVAEDTAEIDAAVAAATETAIGIRSQLDPTVFSFFIVFFVNITGINFR